MTKTRLVVDDQLAPMVGADLRLRAQRVSRGVTAARIGAPWSASSAHAMEWPGLTHAGHTAWGVHAERDTGGGHRRHGAPAAAGVVDPARQHEALITDAEAADEKLQVAQAAAGQAGRVDDAQMRLLLRQAFAAVSALVTKGDLRAQTRV